MLRGVNDSEDIMADARGATQRAGVWRTRLAVVGVIVAALAAGALGGCSSDDADASEDLVGTWLLSLGPTWEISDDSISVSGGFVDRMEYTATDSTIKLTDVAGPSACPPNQLGTYEWEINDDVLSLTIVSDECVGRGTVLDGVTLDRVE